MSSADLLAVSPAAGLEAPACACGARSYRTLLRGDFERVYVRLYPFAVAECAECGLARTLPVPDARQYDAGYAMTTRDGEFTGGAADEWSEQRARWIAERAPGRRVLDVGCNGGNLVAAMAARGFVATGVDVDPVATAWGRGLGRPLVTGALADLEGEWDAVVLAHVLEHVADPVALLHEVARVLAPGGRAFVFVPNRAGLLPRLMRERWMGWVPSEHVWHFTPRSLRRLVDDRTPLRVCAVTTDGALEPPSTGAKGVAKAAVAAAAHLLGRGDQIEAVLERGGRR